MEATGPSTARAAAAVEDAEVPPASFMPLPVELRLRIYGFLFSGSWVKEKKTSVKEAAKASDLAATTATSYEEVAAQRGKGPDEDHDESGTPGGDSGDDEDLDDGYDENKHGDEDDEGDEENHIHEVPNDLSPYYSQPKDEAAAPIHHCHAYNERVFGRPLPVCSCFGRLQPAILSTNSIIYKVAMPLFYTSLECCAGLPHWDHPDRASEVLDDLQKAIPAGRLKYIKKLALVYRMADLGIPIEPDDECVSGLSPVWAKIEGTMPDITDVRIGLDIDQMSVIYPDDFAFHEFSGVARLPKIRGVEVQFCDSQTGEVDHTVGVDTLRGQLEVFGDKFISSIEGEAMKLGKRVEVSVISGV